MVIHVKLMMNVHQRYVLLIGLGLYILGLGLGFKYLFYLFKLIKI